MEREYITLFKAQGYVSEARNLTIEKHGRNDKSIKKYNKILKLISELRTEMA